MQAVLPVTSTRVRRAVTVDAGARVIRRELVSGKLNLVGESHETSNDRRVAEKVYLASKGIAGGYWREGSFRADDGQWGDDPWLIVRYLAARAQSNFSALPDSADNLSAVDQKAISSIYGDCTHIVDTLDRAKLDEADAQLTDVDFSTVRKIANLKLGDKLDGFYAEVVARKSDGSISKTNHHVQLSSDRSQQMHRVAAASKQVGVWKVGDQHAEDLEAETRSYTVTRAVDFDKDVEATFKGQSPEDFELELRRGARTRLGGGLSPVPSRASTSEGSTDSSPATSGTTTPPVPQRKDDDDDTEEFVGGGLLGSDPFAGSATVNVKWG
jgi:hypothetical protein